MTLSPLWKRAKYHRSFGVELTKKTSNRYEILSAGGWTRWRNGLYSLLYSFPYFFFFLFNIHQSCSKTSVIIKYIIFTVRFALDLCELSLNFFILTELLPQDSCVLICQDKNPCIIQEWRDILRDSHLKEFFFSLQLPLPAGCRGTDPLLQWQPLCPAPRLHVLPPGQPWDAAETKQRLMKDVPKPLAGYSLVNQGVWEPLCIQESVPLCLVI